MSSQNYQADSFWNNVELLVVLWQVGTTTWQREVCNRSTLTHKEQQIRSAPNKPENGSVTTISNVSMNEALISGFCCKSCKSLKNQIVDHSGAIARSDCFWGDGEWDGLQVHLPAVGSLHSYSELCISKQR